MQAKINVKFVLILLIVAFIITAGVGGMWYLRQGDATRYIQMGDELFAQGEYTAAATQYGRGLRRDAANRDYLRKYQESLLKIQPQNPVEARERYSQYVTSLRHAIQYHGHDPETHLALITELRDNAITLVMIGGRTGARNFWEEITNAADHMAQRLPDDHPHQSTARFYRSWATVERIGTAAETDVEQAIDDLKAIVEADPQHDLAWAMLARSLRTLGNHYRTEGRPRRGEQFTEEYYDTIERAYELLPDGPFVTLAYLNHLINQIETHPNDTILIDTASELADRVFEHAVQTDDPMYVRDAGAAMVSLRDPDRIRQAFEIMEAFVERNPDAQVHKHFLAMLHYRIDEYEPAERLLEHNLEADQLATSFISQLQSDLRKHAAASLVDIAHKRWQNADQNEKHAYEQEANGRHTQLHEFVTDAESDPLAIRADAKIALIEHDYHTAAGRLERLIRMGRADFETLTHAAIALERIGQIGLAHERMSQAVEATPFNMPSMLVNKASFELRLGRYEDAQQTIQQLQQLAPDEPRVQQLAQAVQQQASRDRGQHHNQPDDAADPLTRMLNEAQRYFEEHQIDSARAIIQQGLQQHPEDIRLLAAAARIEMTDGNRTLARNYLDQALDIAPDSSHLLQLDATLDTDDPIQATRGYMAAIHADDEAERAVNLLLAFDAMQRQHQRRAQHQRQQGEIAAAEESESLSRRLKEETEQTLDSAMQLAPHDPRVLEFRLGRALANQNWAEAESIIDTAAAANADQAGGMLFRGAYLLERRRFDQAVRAFQDATERIPFSSQAWRGLGVAYNRLGNIREARRAFEQAYRINPNDLRTVREYLTLLERAGDDSRALRLAQTTRRVFPDNQDLRDYWLDLEARVGDQQRALAERRRTFRENPENRRNAMRLAMFLAQTEPTSNLLLDEDGSPRFSTRRWSLMSTSEQRRTLEEEKNRWQREVGRIINSINEHHPRDLELVAFEATIHRLRGDIDKGEQTLRAFIENVPAEEAAVSHRITLAQYLVETGQIEKAIVELLAAREYQSPDHLEADLAMANIRFTLNDYARAKELYQRVKDVNPSREVVLRLVECQVYLGEIDQARAELDALLRDDQLDGHGMMVEALVLRGEAEQHFQRGHEHDANRTLEEHYRALDEASRLMPGSSTPSVILAQTKLMEYQRTGRRGALDEARNALSRADELAPDDPRNALLRVDVLREQGDIRGAIHEMNRLIERSPLLSQAHRVRLALHVQQRDIDGAINAARQSAEAFPQSAAWQEQYGRLLEEVGRIDEAASVASRAFDLNPSPSLLRWYLGLEMRLGNRNPRQLLQSLDRHRELVDASAELQGLRVMLLAQIGETEKAKAQTSESYRSLRRQLHQGERSHRDVQQWFNAHSSYLGTFSPVEAEQFILAARDGDPSGDESMDFFEMAWLARVWAASGRQGMSRAIELLERAEEKSPRNEPQVKANILFELSNYQIVMEDYAAAAANLQRAIDISPDNPIARNNLAFILAEHLNDPDRALVHAEYAYELSPNRASIVDTLGWVNFLLGRHSRAETLLRQSLELQDSVATRVHLARLLIETNRHNTAVEHLEQALTLNPDAQKQEEINSLLADIR